MSATEARELDRVWEHVREWPARMQLSLARKILDLVDTPATAEQTSTTPQKRGRPVSELIGLGAGTGEPPSDDQVRQWIEEQRVEKYGR